MKKANTILSSILFAICAFIPLCSIIAFIIGYQFVVRCYDVSSIIAVAFFASMVFLAANKESGIHKVGLVFAAVLPLLTAFNWVFLLLKSNSFLVAILMLLCFLCSAYLFYIFAKPMWLKITSIVISVLIISPLCFISFIAVLFGNIGERTVVYSIESPNGIYRADIIDDDQGALGGSTKVKVYGLQGNFDLYLFGFHKKPQTVYYGDWGEFNDMELYWIDDNHLSINGQETFID